MSNPQTGSDLPVEYVERITGLFEGTYSPEDPKEEALLRELAFWRWVAYEGYQGKKPMEFKQHQQEFMGSCLRKTGWDFSSFEGGSVFELGCGPIGMIEFIGAGSRVAFDPLNKFYSLLFSNLRDSEISYICEEVEIVELGQVDLGICFNVLDHTDDAAYWFRLFSNTIRSGGKFVFQVNTTRDGFLQTEEHKRMHPSPVTEAEALNFVRSISDDFEVESRDTPSADNEFFFMAWGTKN